MGSPRPKTRSPGMSLLRNRARAVLALVFLAGAAIPARAASDRLVTFALEGTEIVARDRDGAALAAEALVGATITGGDPATGRYRFRIDRVLSDPDDAGRAALYDVSVSGPASARWDKLCAADAHDRTTAIVVPGSWSADGRFVHGAEGKFSFACTAGAQAKCVRFGYPPWASAPDGSSMAPYHAACVRMVRADYCGDGTPHTVPGVAIQMFDRAGVNGSPEPAYGAFEALWGTDGAVCVARSRRPEFPLADILRQCPRLAALPVAACREGGLERLPGALLGNRS